MYFPYWILNIPQPHEQPAATHLSISIYSGEWDGEGAQPTVVKTVVQCGGAEVGILQEIMGHLVIEVKEHILPHLLEAGRGEIVVGGPWVEEREQKSYTDLHRYAVQLNI